MKSRQSGFTLVEIAIVLVIVGLLLGGVLKGQELINNTKVKNTVNNMRGALAAYNSYQDRFRAIPGDDSNAAARFPAVGVTPAAVAGSGNGQIAGNLFGAAAAEPRLFWQHIRRAGLADGEVNNTVGTTAATYLTYFPTNPYGGGVGINNVLVSSAAVGVGSVCANNIPGEAATRLDSSLDNNNTQTGGFQTVANVGYNTAATGVATIAAPVATTTYTVCMFF